MSRDSLHLEARTLLGLSTPVIQRPLPAAWGFDAQLPSCGSLPAATVAFVWEMPRRSIGASSRPPKEVSVGSG